MNEYIVKSGDTLSKIASQYGVGISAITGYRSGNANLIYPGEKLQINKGLPPTQAPTNVAQIGTGFTTPQIPQTQPQVGQPSSAVAGAAGIDAQLQEMQRAEQDRANQAKAQMDMYLQEQENSKKSILDIFNTTKSQGQQRTDLFAQTGIDPATYFTEQKAKIAEINTLNQEFNKLKAERDTQIANLQGQGRGIPLDLLNNQAAQIERNAAPRLNQISADINSKSAVLQALQGNFSEAQKFVNQAVEDATADTKFKFDTIKAFYDINKDSIDRLDANYRSALTNSINLAKERYDQDVAAKKFEFESMVSLANLGIRQSELDLKINEGGISDGFSSTQISNGAQNAGLSIETFGTLDKNVKNFFISSPQKIIDDINGILLDVKSGVETPEEALEELDQYTLTPEAKAYLTGQVSALAPVKTDSDQGWWDKTWGAFSGLFK